MTTLDPRPPVAPAPSGPPRLAWSTGIREPEPASGSRRRLRCRVNPDDLFLGIAAGAVLVAAWPTLVAMSAPQPLQLPVVVAHVSGMLAGYGVLVLLLLMSRAPALERGVGADKLARWHGVGGRCVVGLVLLHIWGALVAWQQSRREALAPTLWHVLRLPWLTAATVGTVLLLGVAVGSARAARRRLSYETWHALHLLTYVAIALSFVHQLAGPDLAGHRLLQIVWALLYTNVFALLLRYRVLAPLRQAARHRMRVEAVVPEAPGVVSIHISGQHLEELRAEAGQFFRWRFLSPDSWGTAHPFSLSAAPAPGRLRLTVKALGQGSHRLQEVPVGTWVLAEGPYGAMTAARRTRRDVLLVAGGVGVTPMRALFEAMPTAPGQRLTLLYRARGPEQVLFRSEVDEIAVRRSADVHYVFGDDPDCLSASALRGLVPNVANCDVYLCGPPGMTEAVRRSLREAGLADEYLHEERFAF